MVAKNKRLRTKVSSKTKNNEQSLSAISQHIQEELSDFIKPETENDRFLHQFKETKKNKSETKSLSFKERIQKSSLAGADGISKSSQRRRKRKLRDELKPKMNDLLDSLQSEGFNFDSPAPKSSESKATTAQSKPITTKISNNTVKVQAPLLVTYVPRKTEASEKDDNKNEPSIRTQKGSKFLQKKETEHFKQVLGTEQFQKSPFAALREVIALKNQQSQK